MRGVGVLAFVLAACASPARPDALVLCDVDGVEHRPLQVGEPAVAQVVVFVAHDCPVANQYAPEIARIATDYAARGVRVLVVHVDPDLDAAGARAHAEEFGYAGRVPVARDPARALVRALDARVTPEAFVVARGGAVAYRGRIDDLYADLGQKRTHPRQRDLRDALDALIDGRPVPTPRTDAVGCLIQHADPPR